MNLELFINKYKHMEFINLIYEYSGVNQYWKLRFSNDVLPYLDKHYRLCGLICKNYNHTFNTCDCTEEQLYPCATCYSYGYCSQSFNYSHRIYKHISFEELKLKNCHNLLVNHPYIPIETFLFIHNKDAKYNDYKYALAFINIKKNIYDKIKNS